MKNRVVPAALATLTLMLGYRSACAWDYEAHRVVNQLALTALPTNFPAFALTPESRERVAFLSGEPDRWRNQGDGRMATDDLVLAHAAGPDHYIDLEQLEEYGLKPESLPVFRNDFVAQLAVARAANPGKFTPIDPQRNKDHTRELVGFAPWAIVECCGKLRSEFSYLKAFQDFGGTAAEIANAQQNILYTMGVMGHYVGDSAQPLHATKHHHGWVGENPHGYATNSGFHGWIDGGLFRKTGGVSVAALSGKLRPAKIVGDPTRFEDLFRQMMTYVMGTQKLVEPLYQLEKEHKLSAESPDVKVGREFLDEQLVRGGQMLGDLWYSAWQQAGEDKYLINQLKLRSAPGAANK